jgi:tetratricopeptide (TPR) repeat protein
MSKRRTPTSPSKNKRDKYANKMVSVSLPKRPGQTTLTAAQVHSFGQQLAQQQQWSAVIVLMRQLIKQLPQYMDGWYLLFDALREAGDYPEIERAARHCLEFKPRNIPALLSLASAQRIQQKHAEAVLSIEKALKLEPGNASALNHLGVTLKEQGHLDEALGYFNRCIRIAPKSGHAYWNRADLFKDCSQKDIDEMEAVLATSQSENNKVRLHYALAKAYEFTGHHHKQFQHIEQGATIKRQLLNYDHQAERKQVQRIIDIFDSTNEINKPQTGQHQPIFICGLPRSGTTLLEQIISSHPLVTAGDELNALPMATAELLRSKQINKPFPEWAQQLTEQDWQSIGQRYLAMTQSLHISPFFTDKNLQNYKAIGLIQRIFPKAKIIYCQRQPMDNLWGCYRQYFADGLRFSYSQIELADTYHDANRLYQHWHQQNKEGLLRLRYEDLIKDQESVTRQVLDYLGLPWDECCLAFYDNPRAVRTTSASQVRSPLHSMGIGKWQIFAEQLSPMRERLKELGELH